MKFSLSTNWCNRRIESGEEIADKAGELGFDGLELGFHTTAAQVDGFKRRLDRMPVRSVHAFCPVPISAPQGYPELYQLASFDEEARKMAQVMIRRNLAFAAEMGATALVLHAGRIPPPPFPVRFLPQKWRGRVENSCRVRRGAKMIDILKKELESLLPALEASGVKLGLENLPTADGFPNLAEVSSVCGDLVRPWLDTGHWYALNPQPSTLNSQLSTLNSQPLGLHLNDSVGGDDHLVPGEGKIDFSLFAAIAREAEHLVFEPNPLVDEANLRQGLNRLRELWYNKRKL